MLYFIVVLPIWLIILVPMMLIYRAIVACHGFKKKTEFPDSTSTVDFSRFQNIPHAQREFDLVIFGATGFTGAQAAKYIARRYGARKFRWALAGRRADALEEVRRELAGINHELSSLPIIVADSSRPDSLGAMCASTRVVLSTVGPFAKYGSDLVKCCAELGTHYCDTTGETDWVRDMISKYDDVARKTGARIVHFCANDCVPWDLGVMLCSKHFKAKGESLVEVDIYDEVAQLVASGSGGTFSTLFNSLRNRFKLESSLGYDPLLKSISGEKSTNKFTSDIRQLAGFSYSNEIKSWVGFYYYSLDAASLKPDKL
jgi:short subunit dehydrogenase-like uncharacterized protein